MPLLLGGPKCFESRKAKDFVVYFEWFDNDRDLIGQGEPTMFIRRRNIFALSGNRGSVAIQLPKAHLYADSTTGGPTPYLLAFAIGACRELGLEPSKMNVRALADVILDNLPDLLRMPPAPKADKFQSQTSPKVGEAVISIDGDVVAEKEITLH
jgi:hypothetical protein